MGLLCRPSLLVNVIVNLSVTRTSDAVVNLKNLVSLASSSPLMSLFRWASVSVSAAVARLASSRPITLTLLGVMEEYN